jgi:DNA (cytosine-5)-methyltransferase 1
MGKRKLRIPHTPAKPLLLDLFSCAGGSAMGFHNAGFNVVGVDTEPQTNYPFEFIQGDALAFMRAIISNGMRLPDGRAVDAVNASPPCQRWSQMSTCRPGLAESYPDLIEPTRALLVDSGAPYVMENVPRAPLRDPVMLCGHMFGRELYRHRMFESNVRIPQPMHVAHTKSASKAGHWTPGTVMSISGHVHPIAHAREIMEIDWTNRDELGEAVPPYYTEYLGRYVMRAVNKAAFQRERYARVSA